MQERRTTRVGVALCVVSACLSVAGLWLAGGPGGSSLSDLVGENTVTNAANGVSLAVLAALVLRLRPANRIGWLVLAIACANSVTMFGTGWALASDATGLPGGAFFAWWGSWPWAPAWLLGSSLVLLLYPSGRTVSRFGHRLAVASLVSAVGLAIAMAGLDATYESVLPGRELGHNPVTGGHLQGPLLVLCVAAAVLGGVVALLTWGYTAVRLWRATSPEREQLLWLVLAVVPPLVVGPLNNAWVELVVDLLATGALAVGIVRYRLFDIKPVMRSGLVYGTLTAFSVGAYFGVVALIGTVTPDSPVSILFAVAAVGLLVVPAHRSLQRFFGRLVYGDRADPLRALRRVGEGATSGGDGLRPMLAGVADALRSPRVEVYDERGILAQVGTDARGLPEHRVPLEYAGDRVGELVVCGRTDRDRLGRADRRLVAALAVPVAAAVHAARTADELELSRARVLTVREAERDRLRADLHDGVGPSLAGISLGLEAARRATGPNPERLPEILEVLHREVTSLVGEVRGIIDDLGTEDVDLLGSLQRQVAAVTTLGLDVELQHETALTAPPMIAVAARRIAGEALANAVRHARASRITVSVADRPEGLVLEVADDGCGTVEVRPGGLGLTSMRRRAEAVGGVLDVDAAPGRGTVVRAVLPAGVVT